MPKALVAALLLVFSGAADAGAQSKAASRVQIPEPLRLLVNGLVAEMLQELGLPPEIHVKPGGTDVARARESGTERLIWLGDSIAPLLGQPPSRWIARGIAAHEIGHHLAGHLVGTRSKDRTSEQEEEANYFAGFLLGQYGATLTEAQLATEALLEDNDPRYAPQLGAVARGWCSAMLLATEGRPGRYVENEDDCSHLLDKRPRVAGQTN